MWDTKFDTHTKFAHSVLQIKMHTKRGELEGLSWELFKKSDLQAGSTNRGWLLASTERFLPDFRMELLS